MSSIFDRNCDECGRKIPNPPKPINNLCWWCNGIKLEKRLKESEDRKMKARKVFNELLPLYPELEYY